MSSGKNKKEVCWYVMRDLKRSNAKLPAYKQLKEMNIEVFTPIKSVQKIKDGNRINDERPFIQDLLFVHDTQEVLDKIVYKIPTLQYRFQKGGGYCKPMVVPDAEMERFIHAVNTSVNPHYYHEEEIMDGRRIRIVGGPLKGYEGCLLTLRGSKVKRLLVTLPNFFSVGVEVDPNTIEFL